MSRHHFSIAKRAICFSLAVLHLATTQAQTTQNVNHLASPIFQTSGMEFYSPRDFYTGNMDSLVLSYIPENKVLSAQNHKQSRLLMNFLLGEGVSMGFGTNPNRDSFFDLYGTLSVDVELAYPPPQFGETLESEGGKRYFPDHDATHLWALRGVGPRLSEISTPERRKKAIHEWAKILMDVEGLATAYNSAYQVREYWNFRFRQEGHSEEEIRRFEEANRAVLSIGKWNYESYMDVVLTNVRGQLKEQYNLLKDNITYEQMLKARAAGVPELFPPLSERFSPKMEEMFFKYAFAPLFSLASLYRPINGYHALMKGTIQLLEYYYSPYYVRWADMFKIGEDLETAKRKVEERIALFKKDQIFEDVPVPAKGRFETQQLRNVLTQQGRKLIELQELAKVDSTVITQKDIQDIDSWLKTLQKFNEELLSLKERNASVEPEQVSEYQKRYIQITDALETRFPVAKYIPSRLRLGYASYENFWRDPFAVVLDREVVLTKFVSAKGIWKEALKARFEALRTQNPETVDMAMDPYVKIQLEQQLAYVFNKTRSQIVKSGVNEARDIQSRIKKMKELVATQFTNFDMQMKEYQHLDWAERVEVIRAAETVQNRLNQLINRLQVLSIEAPSAELLEVEAEIKKLSRQSLIRMQKIITALDLSALRASKSSLFDASISHMLTWVVESLGTPFKWHQVKTFDPNLKTFYKFHLAKLKKLTSTQNSQIFTNWWKEVRKSNKATTVCSSVTLRCMDRNFLDEIARIDLVDRDGSKTPQGMIKKYEPIKSRVFDLMDERDNIRANRTCRKVISP